MAGNILVERIHNEILRSSRYGNSNRANAYAASEPTTSASNVEETATILEDRLSDILTRPTTVVVLDCHLLRHLGRTQATVLADATERIQSEGGRVVVRQPNAEAREVLDLPLPPIPGYSHWKPPPG